MKMICPKTQVCERVKCVHHGEHTHTHRCDTTNIGHPKNPTGCPICINIDEFNRINNFIDENEFCV
jgi:hypothetical protein